MKKPIRNPNFAFEVIFLTSAARDLTESGNHRAGAPSCCRLNPSERLELLPPPQLAFVIRHCSFAIGLSLIWSVMALYAQTFAIDRNTIAGGGGTSSGGQFALSGTIGQPDTGTLSGGNYALEGGFWATAQVVQTPGAPTLQITFSGGSVTLFWSSPANDFILEYTDSLSNVDWEPVTQTIAHDGEARSVTLPITTATRFYRLRQP